MKWQILLIVIAAVICNTCATNPVSRRKQLVFMSEKQEIAMGQQADPQIQAEFGVYEDKALQDFINEKGQQMAAVSHRSNLEFHFRIVDSEVINAFAVPGGYVYFTRGIMAHFNNEAQFAGVLGHEIGHVTARHTVEQQRNQILSQVGLIAGIVLAPELGQILAEPASQGLALMLLKFGRDAERESDLLGVEYSTRIGYDAREMADFFLTLERQGAQSGQGELPEFLSTHPSPANRYDRVHKLAKDCKGNLKVQNPKVNRNSYLQMIDGIVYGEDPRQGYLENHVFYHPGLKFSFDVPTGWRYQNTPSQVQLASTDGKGMMMLKAAKGTSPKDAATAFVEQNNLQAHDAEELTVNGHPAFAVLADSPAQQGPGLRTQSYFIKYGELIYMILGASVANDFGAFQPTFTKSQESFKELTDPAKINKKPQRVRIKNVTKAQTLQSALASFDVNEKRLEEHAILNGKKLEDQLEAGTPIKVIGE
jgi:predicted Zn-dependent protease